MAFLFCGERAMFVRRLGIVLHALSDRVWQLLRSMLLPAANRVVRLAAGMLAALQPWQGAVN
jgi:hypothetical protein